MKILSVADDAAAAGREIEIEFSSLTATCRLLIGHFLKHQLLCLNVHSFRR